MAPLLALSQPYLGIEETAALFTAVKETSSQCSGVNSTQPYLSCLVALPIEGMCVPPIALRAPLPGNVLMAARQAGFGGTITTLACAQEDKVKALLSIPENFAVCAVVPLGKPVKQLTKLKRLPVEEIAICERFDGKAFSR